MFRAMAVFVLVIGAVAGVYLGFGRPGSGTVTAADAVDPTASATVDLAAMQASAQAKAKAAEAAAADAARAKKANDIAKREQEAAASRSETRTGFNFKVPTSCKEYTGNRAIGCALLLDAGFKLDQMPCLEKLWTRESNWNTRSENKSSGAYGIPQALPGDRMATYGSDWRTNPVTQIKWGLNYIKNRYKTPCGAWAHSEASGWY
jgi:hypothetical protein